MFTNGKAIFAFVLVLARVTCAQNGGGHNGDDDGHDSSHGNGHAGMAFMNPPAMSQMELASGTSANPPGLIMPMMMRHFGAWNAMFMGSAFVTDTQQSGPRGGDKLYSTNWLMASVQHKAGAKASFQAELMLSLEPATVTNRSYPLLFQTGETAYGNPLGDAQHPHNFIMALGFHYTREIAARTFVDVYVAPVGDPALGPVAFPHRASASELPQAPISHHLQDSTHIANGVVTLGVSRAKFKLEASGFHGAEPGENRWILPTAALFGKMDSWSTRLWYFPTSRWAAQVSVGRLAHPEALETGDQVRATASLAYAKRMRGGSWSSSLIWGRTHSTATQRDLNSYLAESVLPIRGKDLITGRVEWADKDELLNVPSGTYRVAAYTIGYTREVERFAYVATAIGANFSAYSVPAAIQPFYGEHPVGANMFVRFRLRERE